MSTENLAVKRLTLPGVSITKATLFNALSRCGLRQSVRLAETPLILRFLPDVPRFDALVSLRVTVNGDIWRLDLSSGDMLLVHPLFKDPAVAAIALRDLPPGLILAMAEVLSAPALETLGTALGCPVKLVGAAQEADRGLMPVAGGQFLWPDREARTAHAYFRLAATDAAALEAARHLGGIAAQTAGFLTDLLDRVPYTLSVVAGEVSLDRASMAGLCPGDVLLAEQWQPAAARATLQLLGPDGPLARAEGDFQEHTLTLTAPLTGVTETTMQETDQLEVRLSFELDRRTVTLGELKTLEPGYVFRMNATADAPVTVLANGRPIARGRLVDVGGVTGVQLTQKASLEARAADGDAK